MAGKALKSGPAGRRDGIEPRLTCRWARSATTGAARAGLVTELENSLRRLDVDHVDLYQMHRWDPTTSDEETLSAPSDLQRAGKTGYFGSSTFPAYRIVQAQWAARQRHLSRYVT